MKDIVGKIACVVFLICLCYVPISFAMQVDDFDIDHFLTRIRPLSERHDRTKDNYTLQIKRDVKIYIQNHYTDQTLTDFQGRTKREYIQQEGLLKIFPEFLREQTSIKIVQLCDLYRLGAWQEEENLCNDIFKVIFNLENNAHPFSDFPQHHPFRQQENLMQLLQNNLQTLQGPASAA